MIDWNHVDTVFLDMDGTLLDLHFDNHFWREHVPLRFAEINELDVDAAKDHLFPRFSKVEGTMQWYCVDYWSDELGLDIAELKAEVKHLISIHPHVTDFLDAVRASGRHVALVTNAHMKSLDLKMQHTQLGGHFDNIVCSHDYGMPKEVPEFWQRLHSKYPFTADSTLLVDDSLPVLRSARDYGIANLLAVLNPDTKGPRKDVEEFNAISSFDDIMP